MTDRHTAACRPTLSALPEPETQEVQECRSEEGTTVGLVDALISILRVLAPRDLTTTNAQEALADLSADRDLRTVLAADGTHTYLSTSCLHGNHTYCQSTTGKAGAKSPAQCKSCGAPCICECHRGGLAAEEIERDRLAAELEDAETRATGFLTERDQAQAALDRVRHLVTGTAATTAPGISDYDIGRHNLATEVLAALDGAEPAPAATQATEDETTTRVFTALHRSAEQDVTRVIALYEQWVTAGAPPLGTLTSRWWDARLVELHNAILPTDTPPQPPRSHASSPPRAGDG